MTIHFSLLQITRADNQGTSKMDYQPAASNCRLPFSSSLVHLIHLNNIDLSE